VSCSSTSASPRAPSAEGDILSIRRTLRARWGIVAAPALLYIFSYFHRVAPVVVAGDLDANWAGATVLGGRVHPLEAYRAAFTLCFAVALASFLMACLTTETRCRNVWAQAHPHA
jgi:hypothetical protein